MYCVYRTEYLGNKLPRYYIGSSSIQKIKEGYYGSVSSLKYKDVWLSEDRSLFKVEVLEVFDNRKAALKRELEIQKELNVVENENYVNMSYAQPSGFFGMDVSGKNNPMYGKSRKGEKHKGGNNISNALKEMYNSEKGTELKKKSSIRLSTNNPSKNPEILKKTKETWKAIGRGIGEKNGMYGKKSPNNGKTLYNNGAITKAFFEGEQPIGWSAGRHKLSK
jgi:hypothetical protein